MPSLAEWITEIMARFGYVGVGALVALENLVPPIPSEVVLPLAGFAAARGVLGFWGVVLAATLGSVAGALALYGIGRGVGEARLRALAERHGGWLLLSGEDIDRANAWFRRRGAWAVLLGRLVPGVRSYVSVPAGVARLPVLEFVALTAAGSAVWNLALVWLGLQLGARWHLVAPWMERLQWLVVAIVAAVVVLWLARRLRMRERPQRAG